MRSTSRPPSASGGAPEVERPSRIGEGSRTMVSDRERMWRLAGRYTGLGIEIAISIAVCTLGGWWLGQRLEAAWPFWVGLGLGVGAAVRSVMRVVRTTKLGDL